MLVEPDLIEDIERTNVVLVRNPLQGQGKDGGIKRDSYIMDVGKGRNCYSCRGFGHLVRNCRN